MVQENIKKMQQHTKRNMLILMEMQDKLNKVHNTNTKILKYCDTLPPTEEVLKSILSLQYYDTAISSILGILSSLPEIEITDIKRGNYNDKRGNPKTK